MHGVRPHRSRHFAVRPCLGVAANFASCWGHVGMYWHKSKYSHVLCWIAANILVSLFDLVSWCGVPRAAKSSIAFREALVPRRPIDVSEEPLIPAKGS